MLCNCHVCSSIVTKFFFYKYTNCFRVKLCVLFQLYDAICGFVHPVDDDVGDGKQDVQSPEVIEVKTRLEEQEVK